ncbi:Acyl-CoA N-acyltransferase [Penicillium occitanis (nom. inval.)]|nr:Acyl-CoA N-acyltransferase [Penicillium occitanis (nom. inval.)]PCG88927.1 hypothetical protein PENOC_108820 [Penicillium occitanis (nom. inval.)]
MAFELAEVTSDGDFDELIPLLWRAYSAEPRVTPLSLTFPADDDSTAAREKQVAQCQAAMMHMHRSDATSHWLKVTNVATGKIIAGCRWHIHEKDPYSNAPDKPFGLQVIFTDPDYRNLGAGRMMLEWGTKKADEMGLESFVEASYLGSLLNQKFGFITVSKELVDTHVPDASDEWKDMETRFPPPPVYCMWRPVGGQYEENMSLPW